MAEKEGTDFFGQVISRIQARNAVELKRCKEIKRALDEVKKEPKSAFKKQDASRYC